MRWPGWKTREWHKEQRAILAEWAKVHPQQCGGLGMCPLCSIEYSHQFDFYP